VDIEELVRTSHVLFPVHKEEILSTDLAVPDALAALWVQIASRGRKPDPMTMTVSDYDDDARPLWRIPEVVTWSKNVHAHLLFLPYMLSELSLAWYLCCLVEARTERTSVGRPITTAAEDKVKQLRGEVEKGLGELYHRVQTTAEAMTPYGLIVPDWGWGLRSAGDDFKKRIDAVFKRSYAAGGRGECFYEVE
jgi:hypothetical protein